MVSGLYFHFILKYNLPRIWVTGQRVEQNHLKLAPTPTSASRGPKPSSNLHEQQQRAAWPYGVALSAPKHRAGLGGRELSACRPYKRHKKIYESSK